MPNTPARYAAIDIGSNSIRLEIAEADTSLSARTVASEREVTRLGESVFRNGRVSNEGMEKVREFLLTARLLCAEWKVAGLRAVATAALRDAANRQEFLSRASDALGAGIEIISGEEEARLIHLGVRLKWPNPAGCCLLIDIGGGSAEIVFTQEGQLRQVYSLPLGALRLQERFLGSDPPTAEELEQLTGHIEKQLQPLRSFEDIDLVIGTSATAAAVISAANGTARSRRGDSDRASATIGHVRQTYELLCLLSVDARRNMSGIGAQRAEIIIPGCAVLLKIMEKVSAPVVHYSAAGVRDGLIFELMGL